nr:hypothetical protein [Tanacetum cinerariifolium]
MPQKEETFQVVIDKKTDSRSFRSVFIQDTLSAPKPKSATSKPKLKSVQSLTPAKKEATDIMQALKESKKTNKRQPGIGGSSEGTGTIPGVPDESIVCLQETPSATPVTTLLTPSVSTIPPAPLQQTATPIPPPPIRIGAPIITSAIPKSDEPDEERIAEVVMDDVAKNVIVFATKDPLTFNYLMATPINFSKKRSLPLRPVQTSSLTRSPGHLTITADYFFNNDLEYLKSFDLERTYTTSIIKTKAAQYEIKRIKYMGPTLWSTIKHAYDKDAARKDQALGRKAVKSVSVKKIHGYGHLEEVVVKRVDRQLCKFKECDFVDLHLTNIKDMLLLAVQHKLFHLNESDIVDFIVALHMFTRSLIIKHQVKDLQLGIYSYQKKLNITLP